MTTKRFFFAAALLGIAIGLAGCNKSQETAPAGGTPVAETHTHEGWWCSEHGLPEEKCALCHPEVAAKFKEAGDWCKKHDRPESECFVCHPEYQAKFAALYEAKYGKAPPKPVE
ncbi:MAG TPA: RND transporter [Pirellulales bacterium]|jgi:hypothetical protein